LLDNLFLIIFNIKMDNQTRASVYVLLSLFVISFALSTTSIIEANNHHPDDHHFDELITGCSTNTIKDNSNFSSVIGGCDNTIQSNSSYSGIFGGKGNSIGDSANYSVISGAQNSEILSSNSGIFSGGGNTLYEVSNHSVILGGQAMGMSGHHSAILSGQHNSAYANHSVVMGGQHNGVSSNYSAVVSGEYNSIQPDAEYCAILGGRDLIAYGTSYEYTGIVGKHNSDGTSEFSASSTKVAGTQMRFVVGCGTANNQRTNGFSVDNKGNIYFGTEDGCSIYRRNGTDSFTPKSFTIQHPSDEERWLIHGCLEGPESGVYYRGKDVAPTVVKLPDYATKIADDFTVQITPIGEPRCMSCGEVNQDGFFEVNGEGRFQWHATGRRLSFDVEPRKEDVVIKRMGPYTWQE
jgi:hypothetical protein